VLLEGSLSLEYKSLYFEKDFEYIFEISCDNNYGAHTIWNFYKSPGSLSSIEDKALELASQQKININSDYTLFIQTCNPRKKMALKNIISFINNIAYLPKKIILCSLDHINDGEFLFPPIVEFYTGSEYLKRILSDSGLSQMAIDHIFFGFKNSGNPNMWLKYVVPRLCINDNQILVSDDDVMFLGPCNELLESDSYLTFMEDSSPFYGERTIDFFNHFYNTNIFQKIPPFVCAGMYKLNKKNTVYSTKFINQLLLKSEHDTDEQSAVGMEIIPNKDFTLLKPPKYHHGGFINQEVDIDSLELIHMQGRAVGWRTRENFPGQLLLPKKYRT
jgi:hypothetical protein